MKDATADYNAAKKSFDAMKDDDEKYEETKAALKVKEDLVTKLTPKEAKKEWSWSYISW